MSERYLRPHDEGIFREARDLEARGWNVRTDHLWAYENPEPISGRIPDIVATKRGGTRIVEIKTKRWKAHSDQVETFRRHAGQKKNTVFYGRIVDEEGNRIDSFGTPPGKILDPRHRRRRKGILREAEDLRKLEWNVRADIAGTQYGTPPMLGREQRRRPDIYATKPGHTRIVEIETRPGRKSRHETFRRHAGQKSNVIFYWRVVDALGRRHREKSYGSVPEDVL